MYFTCDIATVPCVTMVELKDKIVKYVASGHRVSSFFACQQQDESLKIYAVITQDEKGGLMVLSARPEKKYPSITPLCPQVHLFEREIFEQWDIIPEGHPWLKPLRFHKAYIKSGSMVKAERVIGDMDFFQVRGDEVHEIAVGPVHAGIIEPGHFRFQCHGEDVIHLEISLGYQYRGIECNILENPGRILYYMETIAGDSSIAHGTAYCENVEALCGCGITERAQVLRSIMLELERTANHIGDIGALAGDIGFLPTAAYCGRIRGDVLNLTAAVCGNRFGRGMLKPGGVRYDLEPADIQNILARLETIYADVKGAVGLLWENPSVLARFENTGVLKSEDAAALGIVGPAARASGIKRDVRFNFQKTGNQEDSIPLALFLTGDVYARAMIRWLEIQYSMDFIKKNLGNLPAGHIFCPVKDINKNSIAVSLIESWRGEVCHTMVTSETGGITAYKIVDPSFHNWTGLAVAMRNQQISDFPLCNKSFNLSYCGHDL